MLHFRLSVIGIGLLSLFISIGAQAQEKSSVHSSPPKGVCSSVASHWEGNIWADTYDVCKYEHRAEGVAWINNHWTCTAITGDGYCSNWEMVPGHWVKTLP